MLPAHLAENIKQQVMFYLQSTFDFSDPIVESAFQRFLEHSENGLFKGPWVQLSRPYRTADQGEKIPFDFDVPFHPFKHQSRSWRRLNSNERKPQPTIVTTGTGSARIWNRSSERLIMLWLQVHRQSARVLLNGRKQC